MSDDKEPKEQSMKVRESIDFETVLHEYRLDMMDVLADGDVDTYELMQNHYFAMLDPYMDDDQKAEYAEIRKKTSRFGDKSPKAQRINKERMEEKDKLISHILHALGTQLTIRKKARISKGLPLLWKLFPPLDPKESTKR